MRATIKNVADVLQAARDLITPPEKWCTERTEWKGAYCALGALGHVSELAGGYCSPAIIALDAVIPADEKMVPYTYSGEKGTPKGYTLDPRERTCRVASYNNRSDHQTVLRWFDRAIANVREHPMEEA